MDIKREIRTIDPRFKRNFEMLDDANQDLIISIVNTLLEDSWIVNPKIYGNIKKAREKAGITQVDLAAKLGIPMPIYNQYERGVELITTHILHKICDILNISINDVLENLDIAMVPLTISEDKATISFQTVSDLAIFLRLFYKLDQTKVSKKAMIRFQYYSEFERGVGKSYRDTQIIESLSEFYKISIEAFHNLSLSAELL